MTPQTASAIAGVAGLLLFVGLFVAVLAYTFWPSNKQSFQRAAQLPLDDRDGEDLT